MTTHISMKPNTANILGTPQYNNRQLAPQRATAVIPRTQSQLPGQSQPEAASGMIDVRPIQVGSGTATLSHFLRLGRSYHSLCRHAFMEKCAVGYYHYERRIQYKTCVIAAAYAGAFGPQAIEAQGFSYSMAIWRLSQKIGYDLNRLHVYGPTGRCQSVAQEAIQLVDQDGWTREGVAEWLESLRL